MLSKKQYIKPGLEVVSYQARRTFIAYLIITVPLFFWLISGSKGDIFFSIFALALVFVIGFPFFLCLALIAGTIYNRLVGQPGIWTGKLKVLWPELEGFRDYIKMVELDKLQFESNELKLKSKSDALPYAVALGLNTEWQKRF